MITVTASGKKGTAPRRLADKIASALDLVDLSDEGVRLLDAARRGANKIISVAPRGSEVTININLVEGPLGGWSASCLVDVEEPRR